MVEVIDKKKTKDRFGNEKIRVKIKLTNTKKPFKNFFIMCNSDEELETILKELENGQEE